MNDINKFKHICGRTSNIGERFDDQHACPRMNDNTHRNHHHHHHHHSHHHNNHHHPPPATMSSALNLGPEYYEETPRRYFTLGVLCCCISGFVFFIGIIFMVFGSSPSIPEAIYIAGIVLLLLGGFLFIMGVASIGMYYSREDKRRNAIEFINAENMYTSSVVSASGRGMHSPNIYLID